jgi:hypothetical protein
VCVGIGYDDIDGSRVKEVNIPLVIKAFNTMLIALNASLCPEFLNSNEFPMTVLA